MKALSLKTIFLFALGIFLMACNTSQNITAQWKDKSTSWNEPVKKLFIAAMSDDFLTRARVEEKLKEKFVARGVEVVLSTELFPRKQFPGNAEIPEEKMAEMIRGENCDYALTIALLDVKTEERYQPGTEYVVSPFVFYRNYYRYYYHRYPVIYEPGYYTETSTYFLETNLFSMTEEKLVWSTQSDAYNPSGFDSWFKGYSKLIMKQLEKDGIIPLELK